MVESGSGKHSSSRQILYDNSDPYREADQLAFRNELIG